MTAKEEIHLQLLHLTRTDVLLWEYDKGGFYIAHYKSKTCRVNCCTGESLLLVDGEIYNVGKDTIKALCNEIARQDLRLRQENEKLQQLNEWLKETA